MCSCTEYTCPVLRSFHGVICCLRLSRRAACGPGVFYSGPPEHPRLDQQEHCEGELAADAQRSVRPDGGEGYAAKGGQEERRLLSMRYYGGP